MEFAALVAEDSAPQTVVDGEDEGVDVALFSGVGGGQVLEHKFDASFAAEFLLVGSEVLAKTGEDVEGVLSELERVVLFVLNDVHQDVHDALFRELFLEEVVARSVEDGLSAGQPAFSVGVLGQEANEHLVTLDVLEPTT